MPHPFLVRARKQHDDLRASIDATQKKALEENRDLTEDELRSITEDAAKLKTVTEQLKTAAEAEEHSRSAVEQADRLETLTRDSGEDTEQTRARKTGEKAAELNRAAGVENLAGEQHRARYTTQDRDPGHYRAVKEGGQQSFFADHFRSKVLGDPEATQRLTEHMRAVTQANGGAPGGIVPPKWLQDEYMAIARQNRVVADAVRHLPLGNDPRPINLPKQTQGVDGGTSNLSVAQATEGVNPAGWGTDKFTASQDTITPFVRAAYQDVSRQLLNSSDPAVDALIFGDLRSAWDAMVETTICSAIIAGATATGTTFATETLWKGTLPAVPAVDAIVDAETAVANDLRGAADLCIMNFRRFGAYRKLKDSAGRPLMPVSQYNPQNARGSLGNTLVGEIEGLTVLASAGVVPTGNTDSYVVLRSQAAILAESDVLDFTYDQVVGPSAVRMGIWGYLGTLMRNPASAAKIIVTDITQ